VAIIVKNWTHFQHYKHRRPPWIRLYRDLLDDVTYRRLPLASRALAPDIWLLASEFDGGIVMLSDEEIAYRLRITEKELLSGLSPLLASGFMSRYQDASDVLAECKQDAPSEKSRVEKSTEVDIVLTPVSEDNGKFVLPEWVPLEAWSGYEEMRKKIKKPLTDRARKLAISDLEKLRTCGNPPEQVLNQSVLNSWAGVFELKNGKRTTPLDTADDYAYTKSLLEKK
jgi:hypothetical protein